jgi:hypothetical protein
LGYVDIDIDMDNIKMDLNEICVRVWAGFISLKVGSIDDLF